MATDDQGVKRHLYPQEDQNLTKFRSRAEYRKRESKEVLKKSWI